MEEAILNALKVREGRHVSGEELSRLCGVSRTAIWKEIQKLREQGYKILAQPHLGYQLAGIPDRMIPQELTWGLDVQRIGRKIHSYETTDSTMDVAHRLAAAGEPEGLVVVAEGQAQGRGRLGRTWASPKGKGIYLSILLRPPLQLSEAAHVTLAAAVSVAQAIEKATGLKPQIKWPNDILLEGKKVAGILTELNAELNRVNYLVVGIGINVQEAGGQMPFHSTSLAHELRRRVDRVGLARMLLEQMDRTYAEFLTRGLGPILEQWRNFADFLGRRIRVALASRTVDGQAMDIDDSGALLVRTDAGLIEAVSAGDVLIVR